MSERVRVVRIITRLNVGGPAIQALSLTSRLQHHGFDTLLLHGQTDAGEGDMRTVLETGPLSDLYIASLRRPVRPLHDIIALLTIYIQLCRYRPRIVHTHMAKAGTLGRLATLAYNLTFGLGHPAKAIHTYHSTVLDGSFSPFVSRGVATVERILARFTSVLIAISSRIRHDIENVYRIGRAEQIRLVPLGFDLARFAAIDGPMRVAARHDLRIPALASVVTTVGRLTEIKQHHVFLSVAQRLAHEHRSMFFLLVGDGTLRPQLEEQARLLGIADRVRFLGWRADLDRIYAATDVFLLTSANEGTPVALIEAMASGVAGVSTDVGGAGDVISSESVGLLAPAGNVEGLARAVGTLLADTSRRAAMGEAGRASVLSRYGLERLESDVVRVYRELLR
jgi:glycosyltransferase involved in cell wall biosynthesis